MEREEIFESKKHLIKRIKKFTKDLSLTEEELDDAYENLDLSQFDKV
jgi:hypothetical protein